MYPNKWIWSPNLTCGCWWGRHINNFCRRQEHSLSSSFGRSLLSSLPLPILPPLVKWNYERTPLLLAGSHGVSNSKPVGKMQHCKHIWIFSCLPPYTQYGLLEPPYKRQLTRLLGKRKAYYVPLCLAKHSWKGRFWIWGCHVKNIFEKIQEPPWSHNF